MTAFAYEHWPRILYVVGVAEAAVAWRVYVG